MQKDILKALGENPRIAKELSIYLRGIGIDLNKFVLEDSLPNKMYYFINFFTELYELSFTIYKNRFTIKRYENEIISIYSKEETYQMRIEQLIILSIKYCEKPF